MISKVKYKDVSGLEISTEKISATFLPSEGGKMSSLKLVDINKEYMQEASGETYRHLEYDGDYVSAECAGFDDMFPTIDPWFTDRPKRAGIEYNDHGEVCRLPWKYEVENDSIIMSVSSRNLSYNIKKIITAHENTIKISYEIENLLDEPFDCLWAAHFMLRSEEGGYLSIPVKKNGAAKIVFTQDEGIGKPGETIKIDEKEIYTVTPKITSGINAFKYYVLDDMEDGWCKYTYPDKSSVTLSYDKEKVPYFGVWINNGSLKGMRNIALEPCTGAFDTPGAAIAGGKSGVIAPMSTLSFDLNITLSD